MRHDLMTALFLAAAGGAACSQSITAPPTRTLYFKIDDATCKGTHSTYFEIDTNEVGPEMLAPGQTSTAYAVTEGPHAVKARLVNYFGTPADLWTINNRVTVPANEALTTIVSC